MDTLGPQAALLAAGGEILTATPRQAEALKARLGVARAEAGEAVWRTPRVLPLGAWLERAARTLAERPLLLPPEATGRLWQRIVEESPAGAGLMSVRAAAAEAERAWQLLQEWRIDVDSLESATPEQAAFRGWARDFASVCREQGAIDRARLGALIAERAPELAPAARSPPGALGFHGFERLTPARAELKRALAAAGRDSLELALAVGPARVTRIDAPTPALEFAALAAWLLERLGAAPGLRLGVIVPDLAERGASLRRLLDDRLAPALKVPGAPDARPYAFARGRRLGDYALVDTALGLLALGDDTIDVLKLGQLLRSPYLGLPGQDPDAAARAAEGARLDAELRRLGARLLPTEEILKRMRDSRLGTRALALRIEAVRRALAGPVRRSAAAWAEAWPRAFRAAGWPLGRTLGNSEYAAAAELFECLARFGGLGRVLSVLNLAEARAEFRALVVATPFEPEAGAPPVLVLDALEDAALPFDGLWVAGLTADRFPGASAPNPFLPQALQRARGMPGASAEARLLEARAALEGWQRSTPELVLSSARQDGEASLLRSGLLPDITPAAAPAAGLARAEQIHAAAALVPGASGRLPAIGAGVPLAGGVRGLERQSECPFKAAAEMRLAAEPLDRPGTGLPRRVRGELMHLALAHFWNDLKSHAALVAAGEAGRAARARAAVAAALAGIRAFLPGGRLLELEARWLARALIALAEAEVERRPFTVEATEQQDTVTLAGHPLRIRLDRLDRLEDGSTIIIDYKTGRSTPKRWAGPRPDSLQLAVYAAYRDEPPEAVAIARLPLGLERKFVGVAAREGLLPEVRSLERARQPALRGRLWQDLLAEWKAVAARLASEFAGGLASVDPVDGACKHCALASLCRIDEPSLVPAEGEAGEVVDAAGPGAGR